MRIVYRHELLDVMQKEMPDRARNVVSFFFDDEELAKVFHLTILRKGCFY